MPKPNAVLFDFFRQQVAYRAGWSRKICQGIPGHPIDFMALGGVDAPEWNEFNGNPDVLCSRIVNPGRVVVLAPGEKYRI